MIVYIDYWEALKIINRLVMESPNELIDVGDSVWRITAEDEVAVKNVPTENISMLDGFATAGAVRSGEVLKIRNVVDEVVPGVAVPVRTGVSLPRNAGTVIPAENVVADVDTIVVKEDVKKGFGILRSGTDVSAGDVLLRKGGVVRPEHL